MKEFTLKNDEIIKLSNSLTRLIGFSFPGVLIFHINIRNLDTIIQKINIKYRDFLKKEIGKDNKLSIGIFNSKGIYSTTVINIGSFDVRFHLIDYSFFSIKKQSDIRLFEEEISNIKVTINLQELDVALPVFLVKDKMKIILRDYLEQIIDPLDLLFYPLEKGVIINLFNYDKNFNQNT